VPFLRYGGAQVVVVQTPFGIQCGERRLVDDRSDFVVHVNLSSDPRGVRSVVAG
jgi:hypothetical protein